MFIILANIQKPTALPIALSSVPERTAWWRLDVVKGWRSVCGHGVLLEFVR